jgi:L-threonylcarbamoyladenylate synthase
MGPLYNNLSASHKEMLDDSWPGPNTWLIPDPENLIPAFIKGNHSSVAVRVSAHRTVNALCSAFGSMIVSTSANQANHPAIRSRLKLQQTFGDRLDYVLPGQLGGNEEPSTIRDLSTGQILR